MCWQCDHPEATQEDYLDLLRTKIIYFGWATQYVESDDLPFAYTIGLHLRGLPELLIAGLCPVSAHHAFQAVVEYMLDGWIPAPGQRLDYEGKDVFEFVEVDHPDVHLPFAVTLCGPLRALQVVWADDRGRWPWDRGWDDGRRRQPVYGFRKRLCA